MTNVEDVERRIKQLHPDELRGLREWFAAFDAEAWDRQFVSDVRAGKLDELADRALRDYHAGRAMEL